MQQEKLLKTLLVTQNSTDTFWKINYLVNLLILLVLLILLNIRIGRNIKGEESNFKKKHKLSKELRIKYGTESNSSYFNFCWSFHWSSKTGDSTSTRNIFSKIKYPTLTFATNSRHAYYCNSINMRTSKKY